MSLDGPCPLSKLPALVLAPVRKQLSGTLVLEAPGAIRKIIYSHGWPVAASSSAADEQIETHLLNMSALSPPQLQKAIALKTSKKLELGQALQELQLLSSTTFVDLTMDLRKRIIVAALSAPATARFDSSPQSAGGFAYLPMIECCVLALAAWPQSEVNAALQPIAQKTLMVQQGQAELAMTLGAPVSVLALMQRLSRDPKTTAAVLSSDPRSKVELAVCVLTEIVAPPEDVSMKGGSLDIELGNAIADLQKSARWDPVVLPAAVLRPKASNKVLAIAVAATAATTALIMLALRPTPPPPQKIFVEAPAPPPVEAPASTSVLAIAGERARELAMIAAASRLSDDARAKVEGLTERGHDALAKKRPAVAIKHYQAALQLDPTSAELHKALAAAFEKKGAKDAALSEYKLYLRLAPTADDAEAIRSRIVK